MIAPACSEHCQCRRCMAGLIRKIVTEVVAEWQPHPVQLLGYDQIAERLGVSRKTAGDWVRDGSLPSVRVTATSHPKVRQSALDEFIRQLPAGKEEAA